MAGLALCDRWVAPGPGQQSCMLLAEPPGDMPMVLFGVCSASCSLLFFPRSKKAGSACPALGERGAGSAGDSLTRAGSKSSFFSQMCLLPTLHGLSLDTLDTYNEGCPFGAALATRGLPGGWHGACPLVGRCL